MPDFAAPLGAAEEVGNIGFLRQLVRMQDDEIGARRSTTLGDNNQDPGSGYYFSYGDDDSGQLLLEPSEREAELVSSLHIVEELSCTKE